MNVANEIITLGEASAIPNVSEKYDRESNRLQFESVGEDDRR